MFLPPHRDLLMRQPVVFCDFDGTITEVDVIQMVMSRFAPPIWKDIVSDVLDKKVLSLKEGIVQLFKLLPSTLKTEIEAFIDKAVTIRPGFPEFLDWCGVQQIPFNVVSGGVDFLLSQHLPLILID